MVAGGIDGVSHFENLDSGFVGRKRELFTLGAALQRARAGLGTICLLSGEAGVGKTLLARQIADFARMSGAKVLEGRANTRFRDALPFGVWKQILSDQPIRHDADPIDPAPALLASAPLQPFTDHQTNPELFETTARALVEHARTQIVAGAHLAVAARGVDADAVSLIKLMASRRLQNPSPEVLVSLTVLTVMVAGGCSSNAPGVREAGRIKSNANRIRSACVSIPKRPKPAVSIRVRSAEDAQGLSQDSAIHKESRDFLSTRRKWGFRTIFASLH
jgi:hypothetical protein